MKVYGKVCHYGELEPGDVLIEHKRSGTPSDLITHAAVVAQVLEEGETSMDFPSDRMGRFSSRSNL